MKNLLLIITLLITSVSFSQHVFSDEIDKFTDNRVVTINASKDKKWGYSDSFTKKLFRGESFLSTTLIKDKNGNILSYLNIQLATNFLVCFSDNEIIFLCENGDKVILKQVSKTECSKNQVTKYMLTEDDLNTLKNAKIKEVRYYTTDGYIDYEVKDKMKPVIQGTFELTADKLKEIQQ
ncbi:hypothetical protein ACKLNQ_02595 [Myroides odoratimimus]|uniref:hypothetical protein n=1 Tax=Myroides odoratimimus TaxID=76832 RepID=UPI0038D4AFA9